MPKLKASENIYGQYCELGTTTIYWMGCVVLPTITVSLLLHTSPSIAFPVRISAQHYSGFLFRAVDSRSDRQ